MTEFKFGVVWDTLRNTNLNVMLCNTFIADKLSIQETSKDSNILPSLPPIQLPPRTKGILKHTISGQAKETHRLSSSKPLVSNDSSLKSSSSVNSFNKEIINDTQPDKEKKSLVIKRKKITENKTTNHHNDSKNHLIDKQSSYREKSGKRSAPGEKYHIPKKSKQNSSNTKNSGLQQIDIFAPQESYNYENTSNAENICTICKSTFVTKKSMYYHLIEKHYVAEAIKSINTGNNICRCPKCGREFEPPHNAQQLTKHYYREHLKDHIEAKNSDKIVSSSNETDNMFQEPLSMQKQRSFESLLSTDNIEDGHSDISTDSESLPPSRTRKTVHIPFKSSTVQSKNTSQQKPSVSTARQRMRENWQKTSIDSQNHEIELLNKRIEDLENNHEEQMRLKAKKFEKWITQKENALEEQKLENKKLLERFEQANVEVAGYKKQLEQQEQSYKNLEEMLIEKHNINLEISNEKNNIEKRLSNTMKELEDSHSDLKAKDDEINEVNKKLSQRDDKVSDLELSIGEKEDEILKNSKSQADMKNEYEKQLSRLTKQLDYQKERNAKLTEEKKNKNKENKEIAEELKKKEHRISELEELNNKYLSESQSNTEKSNLLHNDQAKGFCQSCQELEKKNKSLLDTLERVQKIMTGFDAVIEDKNKSIAELNSKCEDSENNLDQALQTINELKDSEKQKKDSLKQIKQLQKTLRDWENRQYTNVKLISGLEKKNNELEKKVKDFEENTTGSEVKLNHYTSNIKRLEKENKQFKDHCNKSDKEMAEKDLRLQSRIEEVESLKGKVSSYETKILELERTMRIGTTDSPDIQELALQIKNKDGEVMHLRKALDNLKCQLRQTNLNYEKELSKAKDANDQSETKYSVTHQKLEDFKKILSDAETNILYKENELNVLKKAVNVESVGKLKFLLTMCGNQDQVSQAAKVINEMNDAVAQIDSGMCYNLNHQSYLVKSEPVDDTEESFISNQLTADTSLNSTQSQKRNALSPAKPMSQVNTEKQIILNVPSMSDKVISQNQNPIIQRQFPSNEEQWGPTIVKQEPGSIMPSQDSRNVSHHQNTFMISRATNSSVIPLSADQHKQAPLRTKYSSQQHSTESVKLTSNTTPHAPTSYRSIIPNTSNFEGESLCGHTQKDFTMESDGSDEGLDDFFPKADPLSGLTFVNKGKNLQLSSPKKQSQSDTEASPSLKYTKKSPTSKLEDFTGKYAEEEEENYTCGICNQFDPPDQSSTTRYTTEWVGCDCERWFHKPCTKMKRFVKSFSCKSVKMKCLPKAPISTGHTIVH